MIKNPSPEKIAFLTTLVLGVIFGVFIIYFQVELWTALISLFIFGSLTFITILYGLEIFIYRKIKLIYKTIHNLKVAKINNENYTVNTSNNLIQKVNEEVKDWADNYAKEISQLKSMEKYRKEFLGNVSHELKTPLFNIQGFTETLLDGAIDDKSVNRKFLEKTAQNVDRLNNLVNDLLEISRMESSQLEFEFIVFECRKLVEEVLDSFKLNEGKESFSIEIKEECRQDHKVCADRNRIKQVLVNLIQNALHYGKDKVRIGIYELDENILVEVSDNGNGIEEHHLPRLFERFYRTEYSRNRNLGGSGLGLSIAKHIMERHNQTIQVQSSIGVGTTFSFTLAKAN